MDTESVARLRNVIGRAARQLNPTSAGEGLTPAQASVLGVVASQGPLGLAELTELEGLNPSVLSRIVGKLDDLGLIKRLQDPADLRAIRVEITPRGTAAQEHIRVLRTELLSRCLDRLPTATVETLHEALPAMEALVDELRLAATSRTVSHGSRPTDT
jgi:DNA-binding MarR family transcriptional regulator